jgi:glycosyltransferase involved in cell wall biosynthesis
MKFSLIICTYKRAESLKKLLDSVLVQSLYPDEILIIDASPDENTEIILQKNNYKNLIYHKAEPEDRGLTKQRNLGVNLCQDQTEVIAFLDDDIILDQDYFKRLIETYSQFPEAIAVGGYITNEVEWVPETDISDKTSYFCYDGFCRKESQRFILRQKLGLDPDRPPGFLPKFSHGRSIGHMPSSGKVYQVEQFMGCSMSFLRKMFLKEKFSTYFEGYGLYEDADFCFRLLKYGKLYINTNAQCEHHHHPSGRPNRFKYGKMVVMNGWYVWRLRWPSPGLRNVLKWHITSLLLAFLRFLNTFTTSNSKQAFSESLGRISAWIILFFKKPNL